MKTPYDIILSPVITETSMDDAQNKKYTFKVDPRANKTQVKLAIEDIFDVEVAKVNVINVRGKKKRLGKYVGTTSASKKAIVTLTDKSKEIEFFANL